MKCIYTFMLLLGLASVQAQHQDMAGQHSSSIESASHFFPHFRAAAFISHTFIPAAAENTRVAIPSYGLDLEYWLNPSWGIGLHNDLELETFIIEQEHRELLDREFPLVSSLDILIRPWKGLVFQIGPGVEIDRNQTFFLFRLGLEYEVELGHHWDLYPTFFYDAREDAFTTFSVGLGVGKRF